MDSVRKNKELVNDRLHMWMANLGPGALSVGMRAENSGVPSFA